MRKVSSGFYNFLFFIGLVLQLLAIYLFRVTFISLEFSLGIYLGAGLVGYFFTRKMISKTGKRMLQHFTAMLYACVIFGGSAISLFLATNYYFAPNQIIEESHTVIKTGSLAKGSRGKCNEPYVVVQRKGVEKQIIFKCEFTEQIAASKSIQLALSKGFLGFDIIRGKMLEE
jgi:hypothetical protein